MKILANKRGGGSVLLGVSLLVICFSLCIFLMDGFSLYNSSARTQTVADSIADGAAVGAQKLLSVDENEANAIAQDLVNYNYPDGDADVSLTLQETEDNTGQVLVTNLTSNENVLLTQNPVATGGHFSITKQASVMITNSYFLNSIDLTGLSAEELQLVSDNFPSDKRMQSLIAFALNVNTREARYSKEKREQEGYYDCSSFAYACYEAAGIKLGATTASEELRSCMNSNHFVVSTDFADLKTGDLLFYRKNGCTCSGNGTCARFLGVHHVAIFLGYDASGRIRTIETRNPGDYNTVGGNIIISTSMSGKTWNLIYAAHFVE